MKRLSRAVIIVRTTFLFRKTTILQLVSILVSGCVLVRVTPTEHMVSFFRSLLALCNVVTPLVAL